MTTTATTLNNEKLNPQQKLLTAEQRRTLPSLYTQDGKGYEAITYVKFFVSGLTWFITEYDPAEGLFFGLVYNQGMTDQMPQGEWGYVAAGELQQGVMVDSGFGTAMPLHVERDLHFKPQTVREALNSFLGREVISESAEDEFDGFDLPIAGDEDEHFADLRQEEMEAIIESDVVSDFDTASIYEPIIVGEFAS